MSTLFSNISQLFSPHKNVVCRNLKEMTMKFLCFACCFSAFFVYGQEARDLGEEDAADDVVDAAGWNDDAGDVFIDDDEGWEELKPAGGGGGVVVADGWQPPGVEVRVQVPYEGPKPGDGWAGRLETYEASLELETQMEEHKLSAGWFVREPVDAKMFPNHAKLKSSRIPYLLHTPEADEGNTPVPLVLYFGGTGETGQDLARHLRHPVIFKIIADPAFQKRNPCYLFAPMLPEQNWFRSADGPDQATPQAAMVSDALHALIREAKNPPIDTNRIYVTGFSYGAGCAIEMAQQWPGRFAAAMPGGSLPSLPMIPEKVPSNFWFAYNDTGEGREELNRHMEELARLIASRGGDCRVARYATRGDPWVKAWREDAMWEWMFSKTLEGKNTQTGMSALPLCTASIPGQPGFGPERAVDGLEGTWYFSNASALPGDWWQAEWPGPRTGRVVVRTGTNEGRNRLSRGHVEVSMDGEYWKRAGDFTEKEEGVCSFQQDTPFRFLRVVSMTTSPRVLAVRRVEVE